MRLRLSTKTKRDLANRVRYNYFLRLLIFKAWFRLAVLSFAFLVLLMVVFLPAIWTVSPPDLSPPVRISGADWFEAWRARRRAALQMNTGHFDRAHYAWMSALSRNPVDLGALRGMLQNLEKWPVADSAALRDGVNQSAWLLRLSRTNHADLELAARTFLKQEREDLVLALLNPLRDSLTGSEKAIYLKALFRAGRMEDFGIGWKEFQADQLRDPDLPLYQAAYELGQGGPSAAETARKRFQAGMQDPAQRVLASHLWLQIQPERNDPAACQEILARLTAAHEDTAQDHAACWRVLLEHGQGPKARELAALYQEPPTSATDLVVLAKGFEALGMTARSLDLFRGSAPRFPDSERVWAEYGGLLAQRQAWDELLALAVGMRANSSSKESLVGYSYFLEGWAEAGQKRRPAAELDFSKMNESWSGSDPLILRTAETLLQLSYPNAARQLLSRTSGAMKNNAAFRALLIRASTDLNGLDTIPAALNY